MTLPVRSLPPEDRQDARDVAGLLAALAACGDIPGPTLSDDGWLRSMVNGVAVVFNPAPATPSCEMRITGPGDDAQTTGFVCEAGIPGFADMSAASTSDDVRTRLSSFAAAIACAADADDAHKDRTDAQRTELLRVCAVLFHSNSAVAARLRGGATLKARSLGDGDVRLQVEVRDTVLATLRSPGISQIFGPMPTVLSVERFQIGGEIWSIQSVGGFVRAIDLPQLPPVEMAAVLRTPAARALADVVVEDA